jgi:aminoglycoside 3-N-acetyltransferase I
MDLEIKKLDKNELNLFVEQIRLFENVFEMKNFRMPPEEYLHKLLSRNDFFAFVALSENEVIGGLTSYLLEQYYSQSPLAYIYDLAVKTEHQRKGIGTKLMLAHRDYCEEIGVEEIMVQADNIDLHALEFYRSTGGIPEEVTHFNYPLKSEMEF